MDNEFQRVANIEKAETMQRQIIAMYDVVSKLEDSLAEIKKEVRAVREDLRNPNIRALRKTETTETKTK